MTRKANAVYKATQLLQDIGSMEQTIKRILHISHDKERKSYFKY